MKAAIFTIGTELVDGDIVNTNAAWLAKQLHHYGFAVTHHVSTSDREADMREVLEWLVRTVDWVFVSGGLGPTSDDRTRNVVADVIGEQLVYSEPVWTQLGESYRARGFTVTDDHKQQCFFPEHCRKLENPVGSALGFISTFQDTTIVVLPGPPAELKGVFSSGVEPAVRALQLRNATSARWVCLGITESGVAEQVEEALGAQQLEISYRVDLPYVHVKVWIPDDRAEQPIIDTMDRILGDYTVCREEGDPAAVLAEILAQFPAHSLQFSDMLSGGSLIMRLSDLHIFRTHTVSFTNRSEDKLLHEHPREQTLRFSLRADDTDTVWAGLQNSIDTHSQQLTAPPYTVDLNSPRVRKYYSEQALHAWTQILREMSASVH
ncbi:MAG TPA: competence/damage-inducible protein A [Alkalispirochaeta sp.]|nr:competence/damage-inducible protein A [Alkalispirochaeta sp.]